MSIFRRDTEPSSGQRSGPEASSGSSPAKTLIARGQKVVGRIEGPVAVRVEGEVTGEIDVDANVEIESTGRVEGSIRAAVLIISGTVRGDVHCFERVEVRGSGRIEGDVAAPRLVIEDGGFLRGSTHMVEAAQTVAKEGES